MLLCSNGEAERDSHGATAGLPQPSGSGWGTARHVVTVLKSSLEAWRGLPEEVGTQSAPLPLPATWKDLTMGVAFHLMNLWVLLVQPRVVQEAPVPPLDCQTSMRHSDYAKLPCSFKEKVDSTGKKKSIHLKGERQVLFCEGFGGFTADAPGPGLAEWLLVALLCSTQPGVFSRVPETSLTARLPHADEAMGHQASAGR